MSIADAVVRAAVADGMTGRGAAEDVFGAPAQRVGGAWERGARIPANSVTTLRSRLEHGADVELEAGE